MWLVDFQVSYWCFDVAEQYFGGIIIIINDKITRRMQGIVGLT